MAKFDLERDGNELTKRITQAKWFPFDTGNLAFNATSGTMTNSDVYWIRFDGTVAPYIQYLEEGTVRKETKSSAAASLYKMRLVNASGLGVPYSPSTQKSAANPIKTGKHKGFISDKTINYILDYFVKKYDGEVR